MCIIVTGKTELKVEIVMQSFEKSIQLWKSDAMRKLVSETSTRLADFPEKAYRRTEDYLGVLENMVNSSAVLSPDQAYQVGGYILGFTRDDKRKPSLAETFALAAYINSCR
ncbi:MAG TPA: hypothetical protein VHD37_00485 [Candidatus Paceibacterota bacterium]|nr:hypothetical protein [Candidatus Paceibacterota bacterium]